MVNDVSRGGLYIDNLHPVKHVGIVQAPLPDRVVLPLQQRIGNVAKPCVSIGDSVCTGEVIASSEEVFCVRIHAPISGVVTHIDEQIIPHPSGLKSLCVTIESDGRDKWVNNQLSIDDFAHCSSELLIAHIRKSGIVGLGGAGFPSHVKLDNIKNCHTLIINGTECEPGIMCDYALMCYHPKEIIGGVEILLHICGAQRAIIAIEDDKPKALELLLKYCNNDQISIIQIPTKYTSGAEKLLVKTLLDIEIPSTKFAIDVGVVCQNVATTKAIFDAVVVGRPLISRVVTVTGSGVETPNNYEVRLGASFAHIVALSQPNEQKHALRMGGMMMGVDVASIGAPICKITNCIFVNNIQPKSIIQECIRCGQCSVACPVDLLPQQLYWYAKNDCIDKIMDYNLVDCIECRCCDYVCPSHIPLTQYFVRAKALYRHKIEEERKTDIARTRFEFREYRLTRNNKEHAEMMAKKKQELKQKIEDDKTQKDKITAAIARIKKTKENKNDPNI